jgi:cell division control protein 6
VVLDEIDNIAKKSLPDLVQLFKLPHEPGVSVLVVGIANSIDLTERTLPELRLQLVTPSLITFNAYSAKQLGAILNSLLQQLPTK